MGEKCLLFFLVSICFLFCFLFRTTLQQLITCVCTKRDVQALLKQELQTIRTMMGLSPKWSMCNEDLRDCWVTFWGEKLLIPHKYGIVLTHPIMTGCNMGKLISPPIDNTPWLKFYFKTSPRHTTPFNFLITIVNLSLRAIPPLASGPFLPLESEEIFPCLLLWLLVNSFTSRALAEVPRPNRHCSLLYICSIFKSIWLFFGPSFFLKYCSQWKWNHIFLFW